MKVLDTTYLIDYDDGHPAAAAYYERHADHEFVIPSTVYTEFLVGEANLPESDLALARDDIAWTRVWDVTRRTADRAVETVAQFPADAPFLAGIDTTVIGVAIEANAPIVAGDSDLTHPAVQQHIDVEEYK